MCFFKRTFSLLLAVVLSTAVFISPAVAAEEEIWETDDNGYYTVFGPDNKLLFYKSGRIYEGDEYISGDNKAYRIESVDDSTQTARAALVGDEQMPDVADIFDTGDIADLPDMSDMTVLGESEAQAAAKKLIGLYCTHSDESYLPSDGVSNTENTKGGIYDVAKSLKNELEKQGIDVILDETTHMPHDSGAYRRSRQTATSLLKNAPTALFDIHRDALPPEEYEKTIDGKEASRVRLLVGRSNQNMAANKDFAKKIKAVADKMYPGMIKDIFIGKGNYNQELLPRSVLLEFGTHEIEKERAIESTKMMAEVINKTLFGAGTSANVGGGTGKQNQQNAQNSGTSNKSSAASSGNGAVAGIFWVLGIGGIAALCYAFFATGGKGMGEKLRRGASEVTGGLIPPKHDDDEKDGSHE